MAEQTPEKKKKQKRRGRGEGTVYLRRDGRWGAEITLEDGRRKTLYGKTQEEVIAKLKQAEYEKRLGVLATGPRQKLADHINWWLSEVHSKKIRESSYIRYRFAADHIVKALGHIQLQKLTTAKIQTFYNAKAAEGQSPSSLRTMQMVLHSALEYAVNVRLIPFNPSKNISLPRKIKRKVKPLTLEQAQHLLKVAQGSFLEMFLTLALTTGMRHGELVALRWEDVDLEQGRISVHRTARYEGKSKILEGPPKTESSERTIPISKTVCSLLKAYKVRQNEMRLKLGERWQHLNLVLCNKTGGFMFAVDNQRSFYRLLKRAGLPPMHIHDLRHTAATLFRSMGVNLEVVQELLGHSDMELTANVYSHVFSFMQTEAVEKMDSLFQ